MTADASSHDLPPPRFPRCPRPHCGNKLFWDPLERDLVCIGCARAFALRNGRPEPRALRTGEPAPDARRRSPVKRLDGDQLRLF